MSKWLFLCPVKLSRTKSAVLRCCHCKNRPHVRRQVYYDVTPRRLMGVPDDSKGRGAFIFSGHLVR